MWVAPARRLQQFLASVYAGTPGDCVHLRTFIDSSWECRGGPGAARWCCRDHAVGGSEAGRDTRLALVAAHVADRQARPCFRFGTRGFVRCVMLCTAECFQ
jgi:hypothetical protein